ncbi:MAG TPA: amidohydrolase family protein, partial [Stellaceae bacterium]|nr:amidohydrolase family protein [Stellaceae bacterium]
ACVRAVNDWARELYEESNGRFIMLLPLPCQTPEEAVAELLRVAEFGLPTGVIFDWVGAPEPVLHQMWEPVWAAAAETGLPINLHANPRGGSRQIGVGVSGLEPRNQSLMTVANFPMGLMAELMSAVVFSGICDRHPGVRFVLEEAGVGWVPFLFWRFDREYDFGGPSTPVFKPDIPLSDKPTEFVKRQVFFTFEVEEEGGFRRVPEIGLRNFPVGERLPGPRQPVAAFQGDGTRSGGGGARESGARPTGLRKRGEPLQDPSHTASRASARVARGPCEPPRATPPLLTRHGPDTGPFSIAVGNARCGLR